MMDNDPTRRFENIVRASAPSAFAEGFGDRVLDRLHATQELSLSAALERQFKRIIPIVAAASLILAAWNWLGTRDSGRSALDRALNLPQASIASAFSMSTEYE